jgi:hypothetical protein
METVIVGIIVTLAAAAVGVRIKNAVLSGAKNKKRSAHACGACTGCPINGGSSQKVGGCFNEH